MEKTGWFSIDVTIYGHKETKWVKMFKASYRPAGGMVLVLIVREDTDNWRAFMCSDLSATAKQIIEAVADRSAIEQNFHDLKETEGVGQQQVRNFWANIGVFHLNMWVHTMVELWHGTRQLPQFLIAVTVLGTIATVVRRMLTAAEDFAEKLLLKHFLQVRVIAVKLEKSCGSSIS